MSDFPTYIQRAVDYGLLDADENGKIHSVSREEVETVLGIARVVEKIQPTTQADNESTTDQEAIVLTRVLSAPSGLAKELWSELRVAFGVGHGQNVPPSLWSTKIFKAIGGEIDATFLGERGALISREGLINEYNKLTDGSRLVGAMEFAQTVSTLSDASTMRAYGDSQSEWSVALDLLRQSRVRSLYTETQQASEQAMRSDTKLEKMIEFQQKKLMECLSMLRGSIGNSEDCVNIVDELLNPEPGKQSLIDSIMSKRQQVAPVSTGILGMDIDMEGGVHRPGNESGGRLFTLAARTGVGKTVLGVNVAVNLAVGGLHVGFISAELSKEAVSYRIWACATKQCNVERRDDGTLIKNGWVTVGDLESPDEDREKTLEHVAAAAFKIQEGGGSITVQDPWGADVESVINMMRTMKATNPDLRAVVLDHFHVLARHPKAPTNESSMLEERAYKLMTAAKELNIDLIVLAQMNRVGMGVGDNSAPGLDQIRGTDALAHVSHAVWIARRQPGNDEDAAVKRPLELWHAKTRGRQAYWDGKRMQGIRGFVETSVITMDYPHSSIDRDMTNVKPA